LTIVNLVTTKVGAKLELLSNKPFFVVTNTSTSVSYPASTVSYLATTVSYLAPTVSYFATTVSYLGTGYLPAAKNNIS
jgi:hypothetical protein